MNRKVRNPAKRGLLSRRKVEAAVRKVLYAKNNSKKEKVKRDSALSQNR